MPNTKELNAAIKVNTGYFIREQMEFRGWTLDSLARPSNISKEYLMKLLGGDQSISSEDADRLAILFGNSSQYWLNLETGYRHWQNHNPNGEND